jgi:signal transduction histidine kinase
VALGVLVAVVVHALAFTDNVLGTGTYLAVLVGAGVGAWIGAERAPVGHRLVPRLIATGISLTALGDVLWSVLDVLGARTDVSIADPPWFASYVFLCAALWVVLGRSRAGGRADVDFVVDALTIVVVSVLLFWTASISAIVADQSVSPVVRTVWAAYPVADAVLLALVARVLASRSARGSIDVSFAVGVCLWLVADIAYLQSPGSVPALAVMDAAWMVAPVLMARAAWRDRPIVAAAADPAGVGHRAAQLAVAVGALLVPTAIELVNDLRGEPNRPLLFFSGTAALIVLAFVRTGRLIDAEARARRELEAARDAALEAARAKSMFLANMSHEIRTPLTTVLAAEEMLEDTALDETQLMLLDKMQRSGDQLRTLVERILDFSRLEAGQVALDRRTFDLHALVGDVADIYGPRAAQQALRFESRLEDDAPRLVVGDAGRTFQILGNLLDNALKFTHEGAVRLVVREARSAEVRGIELVVADTGIGIAAADLETVFESFTQVDGSMTRAYAGSGLGLAICRELVELMGGTITVSSRPGSGTTFVVRLPMWVAPDRPAVPSRLPYERAS